MSQMRKELSACMNESNEIAIARSVGEIYDSPGGSYFFRLLVAFLVSA
jgi:hypothetical protein